MKYNKFSCIVIGEDKLSVMCVEYLIAQGHQVLAFISPATNAKSWAEQKRIPWFNDINLFLDSAQNRIPFEYLFSIVNFKILPKTLLQMPSKFAVNYHDAPLPKYAGLNATSWALINAEKEHGITWHIMTDQVDSGDILIQEPIVITEDETVFTLNLKCHQQALIAFEKLVDNLDKGNVIPKPQDVSLRTYYGSHHSLPNSGIIDWNDQGEYIDRICRALNNSGKKNTLGTAKFIIDSELYIIDNHSLQTNSGQNSGVISEVAQTYFQIATASKDVRVLAIKDAYGNSKSIADFIRKHSIQKGQQLIRLDQTVLEKLQHRISLIAKHEDFWINKLQDIKPLLIPFLSYEDKIRSTELKNTKCIEVDSNILMALIQRYQHNVAPSQLVLALVLCYFYRINDCEEFSIEFTYPNLNEISDDISLLFSLSVPLTINLDPEENFKTVLSTIENSYKEIIKNKTFQTDIFARYPDIKYNEMSVGITLCHHGVALKLKEGMINIVIDEKTGKLEVYFPTQFTYALEQTIQAFTGFLTAIFKEPDAKIKFLTLLEDVERNKILNEWNKTKQINVESMLMHQWVERQAELSPDKIAVIFEDKKLTFAEINQKANQLARYIKTTIANTNAHIVIYLIRSMETVISMLAILKSGNIYVPIEVEAPVTRTQEVILDCQPQMILTQKSLLKQAKNCITTTNTKIVVLDTEWKIIAAENATNIPSSETPQALAYVMYTSGSTGKPKGVQISHRSFVNALLAIAEAIDYKVDDKLLAITPTTFDISGLEIFLPLMIGSQFVLVNHTNRMAPHVIAKMICDHQITVMQATPSTWQMLINSGWLNETGIKILSGGEGLSSQLAAQLSATGAVLWNLYGPTETTIWSTVYRVEKISDRSPLIPIGKPISNTKVYVLDRNLNPVPIGLPGVLYIAGAGVAMGYLNQEQMTRNKFIANPFEEKEYSVLYNTGDLVKWASDGNLDYIGRIDNQIKIRGSRVELGEIEACLLSYPAISQATVIYDTAVYPTFKLIAYLVLHEQSNFNREPLIDYLKTRVYPQMIPAYFIILDAFPMTSNGKIDKKALPLPGLRDKYWQQKLILPITKEQQLLAEIWSEVLSLPISSIGINDNFFELGGHSLLAVQVIARIEALFFVELDIRAIFDFPIIKQLAELIVNSPRKKNSLPLLLHVKESQTQPLAYNQQRLWFISELNKNSAIYNIAVAWRLTGMLDESILNEAIKAVIKRQGIFRTIFLSANGKPKQVLQPASSVNFKLKVEDFFGVSLEKIKIHLKQLAAKSFKLEEEKLFRFRLLKLANNEHILFVCLHHLVADGMSFSILYRELSHFYQSFYHGIPATLPSLPAQYVDFCAWQQVAWSKDFYKSQIEYWKKQLANLNPLELPLDYPRPAMQTYQGGAVYFGIPAEITLSLRRFSRKNQVTLFATLLSVFAILLSKYANRTDVAIGVPIANRTMKALENLIGFFVNTLVIRLDLSMNPKFTEFLNNTMHTILDAQSNSSVPFEKLIDVLHPERDQSRSPIFQIMFAFNNAITDTLMLPKITTSQLNIESSFAHLELIVFLEEKNDLLEGYVEYNMDLFSKETVQRMIDNYIFILAELSTIWEQPVREISILSQLEKRHLLEDWNHTRKDYPKNETLIQLFEKQVIKNPKRIAIIDQGQEITYDMLNIRANQLAHFIQKTGIGSGNYIAIYFDRCIETIIAFLAVLKTGNAYIPMDIQAPLALMENIIDDSKASIIITMEKFSQTVQTLALRVPSVVVMLDKQTALIQQESIDNLEPFSSTYLAYVLYTSGSTGKPKGVQIPHKSLVNLMLAMKDKIQFTEEDVLLAMTPFTFDLSVPDIYLPLTMGACFVLDRESARFNPNEIRQSILKYKVTIMQATPTTWQMLINNGWENESKIKMICGGEGLSIQLATQLHAIQAPLWNFYGPTETTVWASCHRITSIDTTRSTVSIGRPLANVQLYVLNSDLQPTPIGVPGELYIGGDGVGEGYLNNPRLTQQQFIADPFSSELARRLYRTGDIVVWSNSGELHFITRADNQIKVRGHRIETEAIEECLDKHPNVNASVVIDILPTKERELVAYMVLRKEPLSYIDMRNYLRQQLPVYMIPNKFVIIDAFPLTYTGKIDRKRLPEVVNFRYLSSSVVVDPVIQNDHEKIIADIIKRLLQLGTVNIETNFFDLGAHSLMLVELAYAVSKELKQEVQVTELFAYPTVRLLASYLNVKTRAEDSFTRDDEILQRADAKKLRGIKKRGDYVI